MNSIYLTEIVQTDWLHMLDEYWYKGYTPYSGNFYFWHGWFFQYYNELPLGETIESDYLMWKL